MPVYMLISYLSAEVRPREGTVDVPAGPIPQAEDAPERWQEFTEDLIAEGAMLCGASLDLPATAATVSKREDAVEVEEMPTERHGQVLSGYYLINVPDREKAIEWASRAPSMGYGSIEVRPVEEHENIEKESLHRLHKAQHELAGEYSKVFAAAHRGG